MATLIKAIDSPERIKEIIYGTLENAAEDASSLFRYLVLSTHTNSFPEARYVVLRKFDAAADQLLIYTDNRSDKIQHIQQASQISLLAYDAKLKCQLKMKGNCIIHHQDKLARDCWENLSGRKDSYNSLLAPGTPIVELSEGQQLKREINQDYFAVLEINLEQLELLQLNDQGHIRVHFDLQTQRAQFLVP